MSNVVKSRTIGEDRFSERLGLVGGKPATFLGQDRPFPAHWTGLATNLLLNEFAN
jgi:hypothetical protein